MPLTIDSARACDSTKPVSASRKLDAVLQGYRDDWRTVARYTERYRGLYFSGQSHAQRVLARGLTYDEASRLSVVEKARMAARGEEGHILFDLERPQETQIAYRHLREARERLTQREFQ